MTDTNTVAPHILSSGTSPPAINRILEKQNKDYKKRGIESIPAYENKQSKMMKMSTTGLTATWGAALPFLASVTTPVVEASTQSTIFNSQQAQPTSNLLDLEFKSRFMMPYGPDLYGTTNPAKPQTSSDQPYQGYGFGMGAGEEVAYDYVNHYLYAATEQNFVIIVDYKDPHHPQLTELSFDMNLPKYVDSSITSMQICPQQGKLLLLMDEASLFEVFDVVDRSNPQTPTLSKSYQLDSTKLPSILLPNRDCTRIAIGQENPAQDSFAEGGVTIIQNFGNLEGQERVEEVDFSMWDDKYILKKGLHMPLTQNALKYWDELSNIASEVNFTDVIEEYQAGFFLHPKKLAWSGADDEELLVNLQENNGLVRINAVDATATSLVGYGLKDHSIVPIDINKSDKACNLKTYKHLFSMKNPDTIATLQYNDKRYIVTANEGDDRSFREYNDRVKSKEIFDGTNFLPNMYVPASIFDPNNITLGTSYLFNGECEGDDCVNDARIALGSNAVDYESDWTNPIYHRMVLSGGRGWSVYELPEDPENLLKLVFDSGDAIEKDGCAAYPWAHNSLQDEEHSPAGDDFPNNTFWRISDEDMRETLLATNDPEQDGCEDRGDGLPGACGIAGNMDGRSPKDGATIEQIVIGEACGRLVALTAGEKNSIGLLFDITELTTPSLLKVFHLSPASRHKSPGIAYNDGTIGEIDPENSIFLSAKQSPSGKPSVMFVGAFSGTVSFWEFDCDVVGGPNLEETNQAQGGESGSTSFSLSLGGSLVTAGLAMTLLLN